MPRMVFTVRLLCLSLLLILMLFFFFFKSFVQCIGVAQLDFGFLSEEIVPYEGRDLVCSGRQ